MSLTERQRNVVLLFYSVSMLDMLITVIGISGGFGEEGNRLFNWIRPPSLMFAAMFIVNIIMILIVISHLNYLNRKDVLGKIGLPDYFLYGLVIASCLRFFFGPVLWLKAIFTGY